MTTNTRRTFLKLAGAAAAAMGITRYAEPMEIVPEFRHGDWIEDRGDFYIVRVPDNKVFANEILTKPTIFLLGQSAIVRQIELHGFCNVHAPRGGEIVGSVIDARKALIGRDRPVMELAGGRAGLIVQGCIFQGMGTPALGWKGA